jgi:hypothetical protein
MRCNKRRQLWMMELVSPTSRRLDRSLGLALINGDRCRENLVKIEAPLVTVGAKLTSQ